MAVAPSFQKYPTYGEPYEKNGRQYIRIVYTDGHHREVRWYAETPSKAPQNKILRPLKDVLGFSKGYITIFKGDTYALLDWFRESAARYHSIWGWYFVSEDELPQFPAGIEPIQLQWKDVAFEDEDALKGESAIKEHIDTLMYEPSNSKWQGEIGDRLELELLCVKVIELDGGYYGPSNFHLFSDSEGNEYCWTTASKKLEEGENYKLRGTVKAHQVYRNSNQTVLTRCMLR
jgi:hypothetical protein